MPASDVIPAADSAESGSALNKPASTFRVLREGLRPSLPTRLALLIAGVTSVGYSQYLMEQRIPQGVPNPLAEHWNAVYRLEIVNYDNLFFALPYFLGGAILCGLAALPSAWKGSFTDWNSSQESRSDAKPILQLTHLVIGMILSGYLLIQLGRHQYQPIYPILWLIPIWIFTRAFWNRDRSVKTDLSPGISFHDVFWITGLLILGFCLAAFALQDIPKTMVPDEGIFWETARAIALGEIHPVIFDTGVYTFPVASSVLQGWMMRIFGVNFWGWRFASVIPAVLTVVPLYLLAREWFGRRAAIAACIMMTANPYFISFARMGYNNSQSLFPVTLCVYFFALGARKGSYLYLWLAGVAAGFGFYTYFATWIAPVTLGLGILYLRFCKEFNWRQTFIAAGIVVLGWAVMFMPRVAYTASGSNSESLVFKIFETSFVNVFYGRAYYGEADLARTMPPIQIGENHTIFYDPLIYGELILRGTVRTFFSMFNPHIVFEHFLNTGLAGVISPAFFLIGIALGFRCWKQVRFALPLIWILSGMIFLSILNSFPPRHTHLVSIIPALALVSGAGLTAVAESLSELMAPRWAFIRSLVKNSILTTVFLAVIYYGFQRHYAAMPDRYPPSFEDIASWIAWKTETPVRLIYLGQTDATHRVEYLVNTKAVPHQYKSILIHEFSPETDLAGNEPAIIFTETGNLTDVPSPQILPAGFHEPVAYSYRDEYVIGYVMTNTDLDLDPKVGIEGGINSLMTKPVRYVLMSLFAAFMLFGVLALGNSIGWFKRDLLLEIGNDPPTQRKNKETEGKDGVEFKFHLRIRIPKKRSQ